MMTKGWRRVEVAQDEPVVGQGVPVDLAAREWPPAPLGEED